MGRLDVGGGFNGDVLGGKKENYPAATFQRAVSGIMKDFVMLLPKQ